MAAEKGGEDVELILEHISLRFGTHVLFRDYSLRLEDGGLYGLTAPSGRGKTTLLRIMMGLQKPDAGSLRPEGLRFSAIFQTDRLLPGRNAAEQLLFVRGSRKDREAALQFLAGLLPEESLAQPVEELSGGMQRRAAIARALWAQSDVLLLDEPFTGLDPDTLRLTMDFILDHRQGRTLLLSTHQKELLQAYPFEWLSLPEL